MDKLNENIGVILSLLLTIFLCSCLVNNGKGNSTDNIFSIKRADNSFVTYDDSLSPKSRLPEEVALKIKTETSNDSSNILLSVFEIKYNSNIKLYVYKIKSVINIQYNILAYDVSNGSVSRNPIAIDGRWMENNEEGFPDSSKLLKKNLLDLKDIDNDKKNEIIVRMRAHNGNSYNAVIATYYKLENLEFKKVLNIEERYKYPMNRCIIEREYNTCAIRAFLNCKDFNNLFLGEVKLKAFSIISKEIKVEEYETLIVTGSGVNEQEFLQNGD